MKPKYRKDPLAMTRVLALTQPFTQAELNALLLPIREAFDALRTGTATDRDVGDIVAAINVASLMAMKIHPDAVKVAHDAVYALGRCIDRHQRLGKWGLDGPAVADIEQGISLHEQLCEKCTPRQMRDAALKVKELRG